LTDPQLFSAARASTIDNYTWLSDPILANWIVHHLLPYGSSICEVGAGSGNILEALTTAFATIHLVEPSPHMLEVLAPKLARLNAQVSLHQGLAENLPLESRSVDIALSKSSLHHFTDRSQGVREMARIARRAVAVLEVISPEAVAKDAKCLEYVKTLVLGKEVGRNADSLFSEEDLIELVSDTAPEYRVLHFDQFIDIRLWLESGDLAPARCEDLYEIAKSQTGAVRQKMQIHFRSGRLVQSRRMLLIIGVLE
jgi:SAM-dependent methyltransferase